MGAKSVRLFKFDTFKKIIKLKKYTQYITHDYVTSSSLLIFILNMNFSRDFLEMIICIINIKVYKLILIYLFIHMYYNNLCRFIKCDV